MANIITDAGFIKILDAYFKSGPLTVKLFTNDIQPSDTDTADLYTEAVGGGYVSKIIDALVWTSSVSEGIAQITCPSQIFTFTGVIVGNPDILGYYIVDGANSLIAASRAASEFTPDTTGDIYAVTPLIKMSLGTVS